MFNNSNNDDEIYSIALQPDGKIVAGGYTYGDRFVMALTRYNDTPIPVNNICFTAGSMVATDQGAVPIEQLTSSNTINKMHIRQVTKTTGLDKTLVHIKKNALGFNTPYRDTTVTYQHKIKYNLQWYHAGDLVNHKTITLVPYHGEYLYNVLLNVHTTMNVNGLMVETLDPTHILSRIYQSDMTEVERNTVVCKLNTILTH